MIHGLVVDLFAGGGGASAGIEAALGRPVDVAINHDAVALAVHLANHPRTQHLTADIWEVKPREATGGQHVGLLWASPDCTHFSVAKGNVPRKQNIRSLAWAVVRWAKDVRPDVILLENVQEFRGWGPLDKHGLPDKARMGHTFARWKGRLQGLGYQVDYRVLDASLYGAPTRRKRLFLVARCDGQAIRWPEPSHGAGRKPLRTAAECIDWALPCPSIFERKRPLAEKTLWRIAQGIRRFVLESPTPFIVNMAHGQVAPDGVTKRRGHGAHSVEGPLPTVTGSGGGGGFAVAVPSLMQFRHDSMGKPLDEPLPTVTSGSAPGGHIAGAGHAMGLLAPHLVKVNHGKQEARGEDMAAPLSTVTAQQRGHALVAPTLVQTGYGEREGQAPRALDLQKPLGTVIAGGTGGNGKHALCAAFLAKHFGGVVGQEVTEPTSTITSVDHHSLAAAALVKFRGSEAQGHTGSADPQEPMPTVSAQGNHVAEVRAFLTAYYGEDATSGQAVLEPMRTVTAKHRLGLVTVEGTEYQIVDIGMRMLEPHELLAAQFGRFAQHYDLSAAHTKSGKVRLIGNSVCPEVAEALVLANGAPTALEETA